MISRPRKIAFFLPSLGGGGAEMHCLRIANSDVWAGHEIHFVLARTGGRYESLVSAGRAVHHLLSPWVTSSAASMVLSVIPLRRWISRHQPDVVVSFLNHTTVVLDLAAGRDRPVVVAGLQNNFSIESAAWNGARGRWFAKRVRAAHARADGLVALSEGVRKDYLAAHPEMKAKVIRIYNAGFDQSILGKSLAGSLDRVEKDRLRIVACGRLTEQKDYPLLLNAMARLATTMNIELDILGEGHLRQKLEAMARELGLAARVRFLGFQANPYAHIAQADLFVLSSAWEGFGNVLVEAMAVGTPVISMNCPFGPAEIIDSGRNGLLIEERTPEALAFAMGAVLRDPALRARWSAAARERAKDFSSAKVAAEYCDYLLTLAASARRQ